MQNKFFMYSKKKLQFTYNKKGNFPLKIHHFLNLKIEYYKFNKLPFMFVPIR